MNASVKCLLLWKRDLANVMNKILPRGFNCSADDDDDVVVVVAVLTDVDDGEDVVDVVVVVASAVDGVIGDALNKLG